ncbi:helix-turn-helix transcriptional regulator [Paenibacillus glufosinatiresistens]|uniref:helix-turn-helix transcriptional regulator n=1 Tax=Paenibacillus glufosinatiresistens TaxID=3070657 RepID=UPI00286EB49E|nr:LuxR C-terminal-related transcriptional regulator [Paenibacillus sp. YX.27]
MFSSLAEKKSWFTPDDLVPERRARFGSALSEGVSFSFVDSPSQPRMSDVPENSLLSCIHSVTARSAASVVLPFTLMAVSAEGRVLELIHSNETLRREAEQAGLRRGLMLDSLHAGMNAVSLAMETGGPTVVRGVEHSHPVFRQWNCICAPLVFEDRRYGFLDLSFSVAREVEFAVPFVIKLAEDISAQVQACDPCMRRSRIQELFQEFGLTPREREVAELWMNKKGALHISSQLGISEGTVRNTVKRIYEKMKVSDRAEMIGRLL